MIIRNHDWKNWTEVLPVEAVEDSDSKKKPLTRPRPGHADLAGAIKYDFDEARYILERASARETTARVAAGALAKQFLRQFGVEVLSHVVQAGSATLEREAEWAEIEALSHKENVPSGLRRSGRRDTHESRCRRGLPHGATLWAASSKCARTACRSAWVRTSPGIPASTANSPQAILSIQAVKGVFIGSADEAAAYFGSKVQDTIGYSRERQAFTRGSNKAGGIEGGISNGQEIVVRGLIKPISTLRKPLESVDMQTKEAALGAYERSDVCVLPGGRRHRRGDGRPGPGAKLS